VEDGIEKYLIKNTIIFLWREGGREFHVRRFS
jgi:hypothetical protein